MAKDTKHLLEIEVRRFSPALKIAFLQAIRDIKKSADIDLIIKALEKGDVETIIRSLKLGPQYFGPLEEALRASFIGGGTYKLATLPKINPATGTTLIIRFQGRHLRAEQIISRLAGDLITEITAGQKDVIKKTLELALKAGRNPKTTALDLVGRISKRTGRREGGLIGLTSQEAGWVENYRIKLIDEDRAQDHIDRMVSRYENKTLLRRGERIARTETLSAMNAGRDEAMHQLIDSGEVSAKSVTGEWDSAGDSHVRDSHASMDGQKRPLGQPFQSPTGALLMHPGDRGLGARAEDVLQCRCYKKITVDWLAGVE